MYLLPARVRRAFVGGAVTLTFVILAGATYQGVATALDRREYPHPGRLVDVGGHQLHLYCTGEGAPIVVLEAPAAGLSAAWGGVQPVLAKTTRVCSYDRAGLGWSEAADRPYDPGRAPDELHVLLERSKEGGPHVVAGHGLGAAWARIYASRYGSDTAALVLIDAPGPEPPVRGATTTQIVSISPWLARTGLLRAARILSSKADDVPGPSGGAMRGFLNRPDHLTRAARELSAWDATVQLALAAPLGTDLPVVTVDGGNTDRVALLTHAEDVDRVVRAIADAIARSRSHR